MNTVLLEKNMKNVLIVSPFFPYPLTSGGHQAIYNGMACLKDVANVLLVYTTTESRFKKGECVELEQQLPFVKCVPYFEPSSRHNLSWVWRCVVNKLKSKRPKAFVPPTKTYIDATDKGNCVVPNIEIGALTDDFQKYVLSIVKKYHVDIVQLEMMETIRLVDVLPENVKKVFVHHELRWVRNELLMDQIEATEDMRKRMEEIKKEEIEYLNRCDQILVLSETDRKKLQEEGVKTKILTSFAVVGGERYNYAFLKEKIKTLVYIGPSHHYPNYDGVMWFLKNCWDKLQDVSYEYQLLIIGKWEDDKIEAITKAYRNVHFLGFVEDLTSAVQGAVEIVPLKIGSGIRMKILEAARLGIPVVSTTVGAEGLPLRDGEDIIIADTPDSFVESICRLRDIGLREKLVTNMQQTVLPKFSLQALRENRKLVYI